MAKSIISITIDHEVAAWHRSQGNNVSSLCNEALARSMNPQPTIEELGETAEKWAKKGEQILEVGKAAKDRKKQEVLDEMKANLQEAVEGERKQLRYWKGKLQRFVARVPETAHLTKKQWATMLTAGGEALEITPEELVNKAFASGQAAIEVAFKAQAKNRTTKKEG